MLKNFFIIPVLCLSLVFSLKAQDQQNNTNSNIVSNQQVSSEGANKFLEDLKQSGETEKIGSINKIDFVHISNHLYSLRLTVDKPILANVKLLNYPFRVIIDIPMPYKWDVQSEDLKKIPVNIIQKFRYGSPDINTFRVAVDLSQSFSLTKVFVSENKDGQYVLSIDLNKGLNNQTPTIAQNIAFSSDPKVLQDINDVISNQEQKKLEVKQRNSVRNLLRQYLSNANYISPKLDKENPAIVVFIDPGHGGKDPGAVSDDGTIIEKDLVLKVAQRLKERLDVNPRIATVLTRNDDYYVPLVDRTLWAQYMNADIFISLHADKATNFRDSAGMSIYTLSQEASDIQTRQLAVEANKSDIVAGIDVEKNDQQVNQILINLSQRMKTNESILLAQSIIHHSAKRLTILPNPVRSAGFAVLKTPNIPSILIELGFLSNEQDVALFHQDNYVDEASKVLSLGIQYFLWEKSYLSIFPSDAYGEVYSEKIEVKEIEQKKGLFSLFSR